MIERYVFIKLKDEHANAEGRAHVAERSRSLRDLPGVQSLRVGVPADESSRAAWDISLVLRFDALDKVETYKAHRDHRAYVDEFLAPRMAVIKAWNFEV